MTNNIKIEDLTKTIAAELEDYQKLMDNDFEKVKRKAATDIRKDIVAKSPERDGDYKKGWRLKKEKNGYIIHNKTDYQLTHLLEKGHAKRSGGRVKAQPHIAPAEEKGIANFLNEIERMIKR